MPQMLGFNVAHAAGQGFRDISLRHIPSVAPLHVVHGRYFSASGPPPVDAFIARYAVYS